MNIQETAEIADWEKVKRLSKSRTGLATHAVYAWAYDDAQYISAIKYPGHWDYVGWLMDPLTGKPRKVVATGAVSPNRLNSKMHTEFLDRHGNLIYLTVEQRTNTVYHKIPTEDVAANPDLGFYWWRMAGETVWHRPNLTGYYTAKLDSELDYDAPAVNTLSTVTRILTCADSVTETLRQELHAHGYDGAEDGAVVFNDDDPAIYKQATMTQHNALRAIAKSICSLPPELTDPREREKLNEQLLWANQHNEFIEEMKTQTALNSNTGAEYSDVKELALSVIRARRADGIQAKIDSATIPSNHFTYSGDE